MNFSEIKYKEILQLIINNNLEIASNLLYKKSREIKETSDIFFLQSLIFLKLNKIQMSINFLERAIDFKYQDKYLFNLIQILIETNNKKKAIFFYNKFKTKINNIRNFEKIKI